MKHFFLLFLSSFSLLFFPAEGHEEPDALIVCDNGLEMLKWDLEFLSHAKQSVEIGACFFGGKIAREVLSAVEARLEEAPSLQVYILTSPILIEEQDQEIINRLLLKYPHNFHMQLASTVVMIWPDITGIDNHVKMFVVDEKYFSMGGTNLDETQCSEGTWTPPKKINKPAFVSHNLPAGMRDQDVVGRGRLAKELRQTFHELYALWEHYNSTGLLEKNPKFFKDKNHYFSLQADLRVDKFERDINKRELSEGQAKLILGSPHQQHNAISQEYENLIKSAKEEIVIANLYFCPIDPIFKALLEAVNRGVKLTVLTNGVSDIAPEYTQYFCWANRMSYVPVFYGSTFHFWDAWSVANKKVKNTRIFEYHVKDILLHKKMMIIDNKKFVVGSYNLGTRSDLGDYELVMVIENPEVIQDVLKVHRKDLQFSKEITPKEAREWYFDPVKSYLGEIQRRFHGFI